MGKKKGKKGGKKTNSEPVISWEEALLAYKINLIERQLEDAKFELNAIRDKNTRHKERNERLKIEQEAFFKNLLKQSQEYDKNVSAQESVEKTKVISIMKKNWKTMKDEQNNIVDLKTENKKKQKEIIEEEKQVKIWKAYKDKGYQDHEKHIHLLEAELDDINTSFYEMSSHLEKTLQTTKTEINNYTDTTLENKKIMASERAFAKMDKYSRQEVQANDWLKQEVEIHKKEMNAILQSVNELERENLNIMASLFECSIDDLKISRNCFLTQFNDDLNLETDDLMQVDLAQLSLHNTNISFKEHRKRPKSSTQLAIENKVNSLNTKCEEELDKTEEYDDTRQVNPNDKDPFDNYLSYEHEDLDDLLQLGPLELKLLTVTGKQMEIHPGIILPPDEVQAKLYKPDEWPVTQPMLKEAVET